MVQHVKLNALHECNDRAVRLCCENGNHAIGKAEAKNDCQCSDQPDGQPHVGREPERKQRTRTTMPLTGRDLLDPMRLYGKHLLTILASHFHRVLNRTDLAHRYLLICYYFSRPSRSRVCRDHPCTISPAGERLVSPYGSTGKQRSSFPGSFPGPIDDWRDVLRAPVI